jgi:hypothetical protein
MISTWEVKAAAERWVHHQQRRGRIGASRGSRQWFIQTALSWLRFLGRLEVHDKKPLPFADLVEHFAAWMRDQRGLSDVTIRHRCWHAQKFLNWLDGRNRSLGEVSLQELDAFLSLQAAQGWGRVSVATSAKALRSFFRHAEAHSWCAKGLGAGIDGPRVFKQEGLPMGQLGRMSSDSSPLPVEIGLVRSAIMPSSNSLPFTLSAAGRWPLYSLMISTGTVNSLLWHAPSSGGRRNILWCLRSARQSCAIFSRFGHAAPVESSF